MSVKRTSGPSGAHVLPRIKVSLDPERRAAWAKAARKAGLSLVAWIREAGDVRAGYDPVGAALAHAPIDDEPTTAADRKALAQGRAYAMTIAMARTKAARKR